MSKRKKARLTSEERRQRRSQDLQSAKKEIKAHPALFTAYVVLRVLVVAIMVLQLLNRAPPAYRRAQHPGGHDPAVHLLGGNSG